MFNLRFHLPTAVLATLVFAGCSPEPSGSVSESAQEVVQDTAGSGVSEASEPSDAPISSSLDLSRDALAIDEQKHLLTEGLNELEPALPNMFDGERDDRKLSANGRVLMKEDAGVAIDGVEGVEVKIEMKTN